MSALQRERGFNLRVIDNNDFKIIKLATREDRGNLLDYRKCKNFINHYAILFYPE